METFDKLETLVVEDLDICENPAFEYREVYFRSAFDAGFCVKNRLNSNMAYIPKEMGGKTKFFNFHHSFNELVSPEIYYDEQATETAIQKKITVERNAYFNSLYTMWRDSANIEVNEDKWEKID